MVCACVILTSWRKWTKFMYCIRVQINYSVFCLIFVYKVIALQRRMWKFIASVNTSQNPYKINWVIFLRNYSFCSHLFILFSWDSTVVFIFKNMLSIQIKKYQNGQQQLLFRSLISLYCQIDTNGTRNYALFEHEHCNDSRRNRNLCWKLMFLLLK